MALIDILTFGVIALFHKLNSQKIVKFWDELQKIEENFGNTCKPLDYKHLKKLTLIACIPEVLSSARSLLILSINARNIHEYHSSIVIAVLFTLHFSSIGYGVLHMSYSVPFGVLAHMFSKINETLKDIAKISWPEQKEALIELQIIHQRLCELVRYNKRNFSLQLLIAFGGFFAFVVVHVFELVLAINQFEFNHVYTFLTIATPVVSMKVILIMICRRCTIQVIDISSYLK